MRSPRGLLLLALFMGSLGAPFSALAIEATQDSSQNIRELAAEARELLQTIRVQIRDLDVAIQQSGDTSRMFSDSYEYRELKRSASDLSDVSNKVLQAASRCGEDGRKIAKNLRSSVRRLGSDISRMASSGAATFASMAIDDLYRDVEAISRDLQPVISVPDCSPGADEEPEGEEASKTE